MGNAMIYVGSQLIGALTAALVISLFHEFPEVSGQSLNVTKAILAEVLGTFALAYVVLNVATAKANEGNSYFGLAIGYTVLAMAAGPGSYSGGAFNPAVAIGNSIIHVFDWSNIWIYLVGCFAGGAIAGIVFNLNNPAEKTPVAGPAAMID